MTINLQPDISDPLGRSLTIVIQSGSQGGKASVTGALAVTFTPATDFSGTGSFQYEAVASDGRASAPATVTVNVQLPPPTALNAATATGIQTPVTINVLAGARDPANLSLAVRLIGTSAGGVAAVNADQTVTFSPAAGYVGNATFQYEAVASDGRASAPATVTVTVQPSAQVLVSNAALTVASTYQLALTLANPSQSRVVWTAPCGGGAAIYSCSIPAATLVQPTATTPGRVAFVRMASNVQDTTRLIDYTIYLIDLSQANPAAIALESGSYQAATSAYVPQFKLVASADGSRLFFTSLKTGGISVATLPVSGSMPTVSVLTTKLPVDFELVSADQSVVYIDATDNELYSLPAAGGTPTVLSAAPVWGLQATDSATWFTSTSPNLAGATTGGATGFVASVLTNTGGAACAATVSTVLYDVVTQVQTTLQQRGCWNNTLQSGPYFALAPNGNAIVYTPYGAVGGGAGYVLSSLPAVWSETTLAPVSTVVGKLGFGFSPDSAWLVTPTANGALSLQSTKTGQSVALLNLNGPAIGFTPDSAYGLALLPNAASPNLYAYPTTPNAKAVPLDADVTQAATAAAVAVDSHEVAYVTSDGSLYVADLRVIGHSTRLMPAGAVPTIVGIWK